MVGKEMGARRGVLVVQWSRLCVRAALFMRWVMLLIDSLHGIGGEGGGSPRVEVHIIVNGILMNLSIRAYGIFRGGWQLVLEKSRQRSQVKYR